MKDWFYDKGMNDELLTSWDIFKEEIIDFCKGEILEIIKKCNNEKLYEYLQR